ncbi:hypothetical protein GCM10011609_71580 [Lentzea pudingi]|uniref:von Willebrand factor type A domain-containing protein n=1 Tax=Lentzea pudingi TaxID=1789439 RepID=A0ABQ2INI3_9PSEU|nr:hypothetical protein [Lentzea pudingi]GGN20117.1 hypothetical protein GCM10011609_71580 [Lentzea pudingi]
MDTGQHLQVSVLLGPQLLGGTDVSLAGKAHGAEVTYDLGDPGRPAAVPTLLIAVADDSASVTGSGGSDPLANRYAEMDKAFSTIARRGSRRELAAVLHFDSPCDADVAPRPLTSRSVRALRQRLRAPTGRYGSSELGPSLRRALAMARTHPEHEATLVVLSDFALLDSDVEEVLGELAAFPGDVHAVLLGGDASEHNFDPSISVTPVQQGDSPGSVARALFASLMTHRDSDQPPQ